MKPWLNILLAVLVVTGIFALLSVRRHVPDIIPADRAALVITIDDPAKPAPIEYIALPRAAAADLLAAETIATRNLENRPQRPNRSRFGCTTTRP